MHGNRLFMTCCLAVFCLLLSGLSASGAPDDLGNTILLAQYGPPPLQEYVLFNNGNIDGVQNGPANPTFFSTDRPYTIVYIQNYHYYNYGRPPGYISLRGADGTRYGPWTTVGEPGQGGVPNAYWNCYPNVTIPPGTYIVEDSDPSTWSHNAASGYQGISLIRAQPIY
jgi:hypothetical protein